MARLSFAQLQEYNFHPGAGGQWYRNSNWGNGDVADNHTHLIGVTVQPAYHPVNNPNAPAFLDVNQIELKIRCNNRPITRVWLVQTAHGDFLLPQYNSGVGPEEKQVARRLYDALPNELRAE